MYWEADEMLLACFAISLAFAIFLEVSIVSGAKKKNSADQTQVSALWGSWLALWTPLVVLIRFLLTGMRF